MITHGKSIISLLFILLLPASLLANEGLSDFVGNPHTLNDYTGKGKWTIVMIWAHDCHNCNAEASQYVAFHKKHKDVDAIVLGISLDGNKNKVKAGEFIKRHSLNFDNLIGEPLNVAGMYEELTDVAFMGTPSFLIYNPKGELRAQQAGAVPTPLIEAFMQKEKQ